MNLTTKLFRTSDLYFAAFVKTSGFKLVEVVTVGKKKFFVFEDISGQSAKTQTDYVNGAAKVSAKDLIDNIRALKTLTNME